MAVVLVVNDDGDLLDTYEAMLAELGHQPVTKLTMASAPETVREVGADALVVDLQSSDEDDFGVRIIEELRSDPEMRTFPIILCSGATESLRPLHARLQDMNVPVVLKPFRIEDLEEELEAALRTNESSSPGGPHAEPGRDPRH
jgi:CheY-like chemotaxis protein